MSNYIQYQCRTINFDGFFSNKLCVEQYFVRIFQMSPFSFFQSIHRRVKVTMPEVYHQPKDFRTIKSIQKQNREKKILFAFFTSLIFFMLEFTSVRTRCRNEIKHSVVSSNARCIISVAPVLAF